MTFSWNRNNIFQPCRQLSICMDAHLATGPHENALKYSHFKLTAGSRKRKSAHAWRSSSVNLPSWTTIRPLMTLRSTKPGQQMISAATGSMRAPARTSMRQYLQFQFITWQKGMLMSAGGASINLCCADNSRGLLASLSALRQSGRSHSAHSRNYIPSCSSEGGWELWQCHRKKQRVLSVGAGARLPWEECPCARPRNPPQSRARSGRCRPVQGWSRRPGCPPSAPHAPPCLRCVHAVIPRVLMLSAFIGSPWFNPSNMS